MAHALLEMPAEQHLPSLSLRPGPADTAAMDRVLVMRQLQRQASTESGQRRHTYTPQQIAVLTRFSGIREDPGSPGHLLSPDRSQMEERISIDDIEALFLRTGPVPAVLKDFIQEIRAFDAAITAEHTVQLEATELSGLPASWLPEILQQEKIIRRIENTNPLYRAELDQSQAHVRTVQEQTFAMTGNINRITRANGNIQPSILLASELATSLSVQATSNLPLSNVENARDLAEAQLQCETLIRENRAAATIKMYDAKIKDWIHWCTDIRHFDDFDIVTEQKLFLYLTSYIIPNSAKCQGPRKGAALSRSGIDAHVKAICSLHKVYFFYYILILMLPIETGPAISKSTSISTGRINQQSYQKCW
jgi:hypothetical protein